MVNVPFKKYVDVFVYGLVIVIGFWIIQPQRYLFADPDTFWHIELGRWMIQHHQIVREGIDSFAGDHLPYIPHEYGFQLLIGGLYMWMGWRGLVVVSVVSIILLMTGFYALADVSRKEMDRGRFPLVLHYFILFLGLNVICSHFKLRPQMISDGIVVWFLVFLRKFQFSPNWKNIFWMGFLSLALANTHAGVYPLILVCFGFTLIEAFFTKRFTRLHIFALIVLLSTAVMNPGGLSTITYIHANGANNSIINEWQPIDITQHPDLFLEIILFLWAVFKGAGNHIFRILFAIGVLYLGISNYKFHIYLILFTVYYVACSVDTLPKNVLDRFGLRNTSWQGIRNPVPVLYSIGILFYFLVGVMSEQPNYNPQYPVKEADWIVSHSNKTRPNVLADYGVSGYLMFRGMNIFVDGREDPFTSAQSKSGAYGLTAFQQSQYAMIPQIFKDILRAHHPDYVIEKKTEKGTTSDLQMYPIRDILGKPVYSGDYGDVYDVRWLVDGN